MPLTTDERLLTLSRQLLEAFDKENGGVHPGFRPAHAKGILLTGTFAPAPEAAALTRAPHLNRDPTPVTVRFSNFAGIPTIADNDPQGAAPRGFAVRFHLGEHVHTDIIGHSADGFPVRTAEGLLDFLDAINGNAVERFFDTHPAAKAFVQIPKPCPTSFAKESFFAVSAFKFTNADGIGRYGRYRVLPKAGNQYIEDTEAAGRSPNFLFDEIRDRIAGEPVGFRIVVQLAEDGDTVDDATVRWPDARRQLAFGTISLRQIAPDNEREQRHIIFDPVPRVDGIEVSADPLFEPRANVYLMSGRRRRAAGGN
jgi:catalase